MIERSTMSIMAVKTVIMIVQIQNGARREEERVRRRGEGGYSEGKGGIQWGYSEDTVRVHWGTVRVQLGYSGIRREEERVIRRREGGYIEVLGGYSGDTVREQWGTLRIQ